MSPFLVIDLLGKTLTDQERNDLMQPAVAGVILFTRNYATRDQLAQLTESIKQLRPSLTIYVDQEGGRVQRFQHGFTRLPAAGSFTADFDRDPQATLDWVTQVGYTMARELLMVGVDRSFAPVLDLSRGISQVIGERSFHYAPESASELALAYARGMTKAGMRPVIKHFPGHGSVALDSHISFPRDERDPSVIFREDLTSFCHFIERQACDVMTAHVVYSKIDPLPATFSPYWLREVLRQKLDFKGTIYSDDLTMEATKVFATLRERVDKALAAGCDRVLICNNPGGLRVLLNELTI